MSKKRGTPKNQTKADLIEKERLQFCHETFYDAFATGDFELMEKLWVEHDGIYIVHPGRPPLQGYDDVMTSWKNILENPPDIEVLEAEVILFNNFAVINCIEVIGDYYLSTSNGLIYNNEEWLFFYHHSSPIMAEFIRVEKDDDDERQGKKVTHRDNKRKRQIN